MKTPSLLATPFLPRIRIRPDATAMCLYFLAGLADGALMPFFALWAQHEAAIPTRYIGLLLACYAGGELVATPILGGIADRLGRRPVLLLSTLGVGVGFMLLAHLQGMIAVAVSLLAIGMFECALHPTIATVIADTADDESLRMRYAMARMAAGSGHVVGPALGSALALISLNSVFSGCGLALLMASLIILAILPETRATAANVAASDDQEDEDEEGLSSLLPAFRDRRLASLLLWFTLMEIVGGWTEAILPLYAHGERALSTTGVGLLFSYAAAAAVALQWPITRWSSRMSAYSLLLGAGVVLAGGFCTLLLTPSLVSLGACVTLMALAQALIGPLIPVAVNAMAAPSARASYMAAISTANDLKDSAGPASGMYLYGLSTRLPWLLGIPVALVAALALAITVRSTETRRSGLGRECGP
ncbi:MFS transporter [Dyella sp.]|uniref:MFS transporter n=1 Tax=Dyella sp. TaxID=1869338 RepID=UPI002ED6707F